MPLRTFRSSTGVEWHVWSVIPGQWQETERRRGYDRRSPDPVLLYRGEERRVRRSRRRTDSLFPLGFGAGWLVFESAAGRRRLAPIPPGWDRYTDPALERLCERALPVPPGPSG